MPNIISLIHNEPINVKSEGKGGGEADVGHLTFCEIFFFKSPTLGTKILVKIDQISPPKISAHFFM